MLYYVMFLHWIADFVLQSHWMATNKSENFKALLSHVLVYASSLGVGLCFLGFAPDKLFLFVVINFALHLFTDYFTSKLTSALYAKKDLHNFFVAVGFDQLIHFVCLAKTTELLLLSS